MSEASSSAGFSYRLSGFILSCGSDQIVLVLTWLLQGCVLECVLHLVWYLCRDQETEARSGGNCAQHRQPGLQWLLVACGWWVRVPAVCSQDLSTFSGGNLLISESAEGCQDLSALGSERVMLWESSKGRIRGSALPMKYLYSV